MVTFNAMKNYVMDKDASNISLMVERDFHFVSRGAKLEPGSAAAQKFKTISEFSRRLKRWLVVASSILVNPSCHGIGGINTQEERRRDSIVARESEVVERISVLSVPHSRNNQRFRKMLP